MDKREAAIVAAYTGILLGDFSEIHKYIEEIMNRPVVTHEMGDKVTVAEIKQAAREDFLSLKVE